MRQLQTLLLIAASIPTMFAQQPSKRGRAAVPFQPTGRQVGEIKFGAHKMVKSHATVVQDAVAPANGVVQIHYEEDKLFAFFVATAALPSGSSLAVTITIDDGSGNPSSLVFDPVSFSTFNAGDFITLP